MSNNKGFSLIELAISIALLSIIVSSIGMIFLSSVDTFVHAISQENTHRFARQSIDHLNRELTTGKILDIGVGTPSQFSFAIPVDIGEDSNDNSLLDAGEDANGNGILDRSDGDAVSPAGTIEWGAMEAANPRLDLPGEPHRYVMGFVSAGTLSEAAESVDINGDGDQTDSFQFGGLVQTTSNGDILRFGGNVIVFGNVDGTLADLDGDGVVDPLLTIVGETYVDTNGNGIRDLSESYTDSNGNGKWDASWLIKITAYSRDRNGTPYTVHMQRVVVPRNLEN